ncbi:MULTISPECIES: thiol:disulfide interchange protein DsbA/DsbL [Vitreoscilla]|uniref:Thiol:disulfide interchange protein n=1 Tax=Vitreoscilla stercoraria TaxID=61 RepID=A0ABY4E8L5_VITST|nr:MULTISPECIES: thiol:disulfide interchange protein DsbA/DsbL [Vitreoscilla]AUZ03979.2 putative thioredoxin [Vitreoscilla sp. C1]UOO92101.1 thiol:disulfide interchange protein DsbA/DsbL [Vitreoscilla stercoraria]
MLQKWIATAVLALGFVGVSQAALVEGQDFAVLPKPVPQLQQDKIEVLEFFGYFCIHCKNLDPTLLAHVKKMPSDTYFRGEHVVWRPEDIGLARITAAVNASGLKYQANPAIFKAVMDEKINLSNPDVFKDWVVKQTAFDGQKLLAAYNGFQNQAEAKAMAQLSADHAIQSTPTIIIGGKYRLLSQDMNKLDELIDKVRQERGMPAAQIKAAVKMPATGARLAKAANQ